MSDRLGTQEQILFKAIVDLDAVSGRRRHRVSEIIRHVYVTSDELKELVAHYSKRERLPLEASDVENLSKLKKRKRLSIWLKSRRRRNSNGVPDKQIINTIERWLNPSATLASLKELGLITRDGILHYRLTDDGRTALTSG